MSLCPSHFQHLLRFKKSFSVGQAYTKALDQTTLIVVLCVVLEGNDKRLVQLLKVENTHTM